jgi:flagellar hook protein FlgE
MSGTDGAQDHVGTLTVNGTRPSGGGMVPLVPPSLDIYDGSGAQAATTFEDICNYIEDRFGGDVNASIVNGEIRVQDSTSGFSLSDISFSYVANGGNGTSMNSPAYWEILEAGGNAIKKTNIEIFDSQGVGHVLSGSFVKRDTPNEWDFVMTSITGDINSVTQRRINRIAFNPDGSYAGILSGNDSQIKVQLNGGLPNMEPTLDLGTVGEFDGLSQFGGSSTAAPTDQDGYTAGYLSRLSAGTDGILVGVFTNGVRRDLAAMKVASFQNPAGLKSIGNNYYESTANSGDPVTGMANTGGAGALRGQSLEKSNVVVATEFVNLIQAQNGYQANARTIRVANDMLKELTSLIR